MTYGIEWVGEKRMRGEERIKREREREKER